VVFINACAIAQNGSRCALPTDFKMDSCLPLGNGYLGAVYSFASSSGNVEDLAGCKFNKIRRFSGSASHFSWPLPFPDIKEDNPEWREDPLAFHIDGRDLDGKYIRRAYATDKFSLCDESVPAPLCKPVFRTPLKEGRFETMQEYLVTCPCGQKLVGQYSVVRDIRLSTDHPGSYKFTVTETGQMGPDLRSCAAEIDPIAPAEGDTTAFCGKNHIPYSPDRYCCISDPEKLDQVITPKFPIESAHILDVCPGRTKYREPLPPNGCGPDHLDFFEGWEAAIIEFNEKGLEHYPYSGVRDNPAGGKDTQFADPNGRQNLPCDVHDRCYSTCAADLTPHKSQCDEEFRLAMMQVCDRSHETQQIKNSCYHYVDVYYWIVALKGTTSYASAQMQVCKCCQ